MGVWIAIAIGLFVLGSIMALKPSGVELRLDKVRMTARRLGLHPKVVACPDWIRGHDNEFGRGMLGQYTLILDNGQLPETYYQIIDGALRPVFFANAGAAAVPNHTLDCEPIALPAAMLPLIKGVYSKANSLVVFWQDSDYVKPSHNPHYDAANIEPDLLALKARMTAWAQKLAAAA